MAERTQKIVSVGIATELLQVFWPEFIRENGCVFAAFQIGSGLVKNDEGKTELECFINHTHVMDEFSNAATFQHMERISEELDEIEEIYDEAHPDFITACETRQKNGPNVGNEVKNGLPDRTLPLHAVR